MTATPMTIAVMQKFWSTGSAAFPCTTDAAVRPAGNPVSTGAVAPRSIGEGNDQHVGRILHEGESHDDLDKVSPSHDKVETEREHGSGDDFVRDYQRPSVPSS